MPKTKTKASPGLGTAAVPHSQETTTQRRSRRGDPFPSLTVATAGETVAQSVAEAAEDSTFANNPNVLSIGYSTDSDDEDGSDNDEEDFEDDSMTNNSSDNDAEEENSNEDTADPHHYSKLVDSLLLEDD